MGAVLRGTSSSDTKRGNEIPTHGSLLELSQLIHLVHSSLLGKFYKDLHGIKVRQ